MKPLLAVSRGFVRLVATAIVVALVATMITELAPGSAAERAARAAGVMPADDSAVPGPLRRELVARVARANQLDRPLTARLAAQLTALARGDLGRSWRTGTPVRGPLVRAGGRTAVLLGLALILAVILGVGAAAAAQLARGEPSRLMIAVIVAVVLVTPPVWLALLFLRVAGETAALPLALVSLAALPAALICRHAQGVLAALVAAPHANSARARGVSERRLVLVHGAREVGASLAALLPGLVGYGVGAAMVIEKVFGIRGLGAHLADAAAIGDAPVVIAAVTATALVVAASALFARWLGRVCDPRLAEAS